jgi:hypothetical protein
MAHIQVITVSIDEPTLDVYANKPANVEFLLGTSEQHLEYLCNLVLEDCVFWLDAHYPRDYGMSGPHINELPLVKELEIIARTRKGYKDLILIDDLRIYIDDNYQSGTLPPSHQKGEANFMEIVKELFPNHTLKIDLEEEGYLSIIPPC